MGDPLTEELRAMFREGATVAGLIHLSRARLGTVRCTDDWAQAVRTAFRLNCSGWNILYATDSFGSGEQRDEMLTCLYLGLILQKRPLWDVPRSERAECWYDALPWEELPYKTFHRETTVADLAALTEQLQHRVSGSQPASIAEHQITSAAA